MFTLGLLQQAVQCVRPVPSHVTVGLTADERVYCNLLNYYRRSQSMQGFHHFMQTTDKRSSVIREYQ